MFFFFKLFLLTCDENKQPQPPHIYAKNTRRSLPFRASWAMWHKMPLSNKSRRPLRGISLPGQRCGNSDRYTPPRIDTKNDGYGKWISAGFKIGYLCLISWGVDLLDNEHRLFVATYVSLPEMFEILWRQDECTDYFAYQVDSCQTLCLPKLSLARSWNDGKIKPTPKKA